MDNDSKLETEWSLWHHNPLDSDWTLRSYKLLHVINSVDCFWCIFNIINSDNLKTNMLFLMKNNIKPIWEDEENMNGGSLSFKVLHNNIYDAWLELSIALLTENISEDDNDINDINGISISPKKGFSIIKIWLKKQLNINTKIFKHLNTSGSVYKAYKI